MPIKLCNEKVDPAPIHPSELRDGQLAEIVIFPDFPCWEGTICMRHKTDLLYPGQECYWGDISELDKRARVRVLPSGTTFEVVDNE